MASGGSLGHGSPSNCKSASSLLPLLVPLASSSSLPGPCQQRPMSLGFKVRLGQQWTHTAVFPGGSVVKNPPANAGNVRDKGLILGSGKSPGGGHGSALQYSCLENPMDRGAWQATAQRVTKNQTWLGNLVRTHAHTANSVNSMYRDWDFRWWSPQASRCMVTCYGGKQEPLQQTSR